MCTYVYTLYLCILLIVCAVRRTLACLKIVSLPTIITLCVPIPNFYLHLSLPSLHLPSSLPPQFYVAITEGISPDSLNLQPGSLLLSSIKQCVVELARSSSVIGSIQLAAQAALRTGWSLLLPTVSERASTLSQLLPTRDSQ